MRLCLIYYLMSTLNKNILIHDMMIKIQNLCLYLRTLVFCIFTQTSKRHVFNQFYI
jgi:hypothetical protein